VGSLFFDFFLKFWCSEKLKCRKLRYRPPYRDSPRNPANFGVLVNSQIQMCLLAFTLPLPEPAQNPIQTMRLLERNNASEISLTKYLVGDPVCHTLAHVGSGYRRGQLQRPDGWYRQEQAWLRQDPLLLRCVLLLGVHARENVAFS
jgi:hypothetical protein